MDTCQTIAPLSLGPTPTLHFLRKKSLNTHSQYPKVQGHICHLKWKINKVINNNRLPEKGETGGVDPAGEIGGDPFWYEDGFIIMMLRVTLFVSSEGASPYDLASPPSDSDQHQSKEIPRQIL